MASFGFEGGSGGFSGILFPPSRLSDTELSDNPRVSLLCRGSEGIARRLRVLSPRQVIFRGRPRAPVAVLKQARQWRSRCISLRTKAPTEKKLVCFFTGLPAVIYRPFSDTKGKSRLKTKPAHLTRNVKRKYTGYSSLENETRAYY